MLVSQTNQTDVYYSKMSGDNFVGAIYRIICKDAEDDKREISLILKIAPSDRACREMQKLHELFSREIFVYDQVYKDSNRIKVFMC